MRTGGGKLVRIGTWSHEYSKPGITIGIVHCVLRTQSRVIRFPPILLIVNASVTVRSLMDH